MSADEQVCGKCGQVMRLHSHIAGCPDVSKLGQSDEASIYWDETLEGPFGVDSARIIDEDEGGVIAYCHTNSANRIVEALRAQQEVSKLGQQEPKPINEYGFPIYPVGTPVEEVSIRDRGQKMIFKCEVHPQVEWASKDPFVSRWFGNPEQGSICVCEWEHFKLSQPYSPTRNG